MENLRWIHVSFSSGFRRDVWWLPPFDWFRQPPRPTSTKHVTSSLVSATSFSMLFRAFRCRRVRCCPFRVHVPFSAGTQVAAWGCVRASDSARLTRAENHRVASRARMLVSARRHMPIANAKFIVAHMSVIDLASQDGARDRATTKRACVGYALFSCGCWYSGCCR